MVVIYYGNLSNSFWISSCLIMWMTIFLRFAIIAHICRISIQNLLLCDDGAWASRPRIKHQDGLRPHFFMLCGGSCTLRRLHIIAIALHIE